MLTSPRRSSFRCHAGDDDDDTAAPAAEVRSSRRWASSPRGVDCWSVVAAVGGGEIELSADTVSDARRAGRTICWFEAPELLLVPFELRAAEADAAVGWSAMVPSGLLPRRRSIVASTGEASSILAARLVAPVEPDRLPVVEASSSRSFPIMSRMDVRIISDWAPRRALLSSNLRCMCSTSSSTSRRCVARRAVKFAIHPARVEPC